MQHNLEQTGLKTDWKTIDETHVWHPFGVLEGLEHLMVERAEGIWLHLEDGRKIMDAISSWWVTLHGHAHPVLAEALAQQAQTLEQVIFAGFTHEPAVNLAKSLVTHYPGPMKRVFFSDNGSTAVEVGVKLAIQYWYNQGKPKSKLVVIEGAYHGDTFGAMSLGGKSVFFKPFFDHMFEVQVLPFPTDDSVVDEFREIVKDKDVAAFVFEPLVQGSAGMRMYAPEILNELMTITQEHEVLNVADEVLTGFGRTGKNFALEHVETSPDIVALSKGLTGGFMPMSVTLCNEKVESAFLGSDKSKAFYHGHSYTANPLACAVANASLTLLLGEERQADMKRITALHQEAVPRFLAHPHVSVARAFGTFFALEVSTAEHTSYFNNLRDWLYQSFFDKGVLLRPLGNVVYIVPPLCITNEELLHVYDLIESVLDRLAEPVSA